MCYCHNSSFTDLDDVKSVGNEAEVSEDSKQEWLSWASLTFSVYNFVTKYMHDEYPHLKNNPFYIFGESYGGHYVSVFQGGSEIDLPGSILLCPYC